MKITVSATVPTAAMTRALSGTSFSTVRCRSVMSDDRLNETAYPLNALGSSLEHESLEPAAWRDLRGVDVALGIHRQVVDVLELPGLRPLLAEGADHFERLAADDHDVAVAEVGDVHEFLLAVRREADAGRRVRRRSAAVDEHLIDVLAVDGEHLHAP